MIRRLVNNTLIDLVYFQILFLKRAIILKEIIPINDTSGSNYRIFYRASFQVVLPKWFGGSSEKEKR